MKTRAGAPIGAGLTLILVTLFILTFRSTGCLAQSLSLYTPYPEITVPPGESIDYSIDLINHTGATRSADITLTNVPEGWNFDLKSGGWNVGKVAVLPSEKKTLSLNMNVPLRVEKGTYEFQVVAGGYDRLPLTIIVSEQGTFKTEFSTKQANMEGAANSTFTFNASLRNSTADNQVYALQARAERGWNVIFKADYKQVSSVNIEPNSSKDITIEIKAPHQIEAGTYTIPVRALTSSTSADLELEVSITGSYELELTTPGGLLSTDITAGNDRRVELILRNTGSAPLETIKMEYSAPKDWDVVFEPEEVERLDPGSTVKVFANIHADRHAIAGDYVTRLEANTPEASSEASFRVSVETPLLWGWTGIFIILLALGSVYYLFRKYGRR